MRNLKKYLDKKETIELKANKIYNDLFLQYKNGEIKTLTELSYRLKEALYIFYEYIDKPTFQKTMAIGAFSKEDYENMINTFINDIEFLSLECIDIDKINNSSFKMFEINEGNLENSIRKINKNINDMEESIVAFVSGADTNLTDSFVDRNYALDTNCEINTHESILTLPVEDNKSSLLSAEVLSTNGLPGTSHIIEVNENGMFFEGERNLRNSLKAITDSNKNSWIEFEIFKIQSEEFDKANGFGFDYKEGCKWITEDNMLHLNLSFKPINAGKYNWFSIEPYLPEDKEFIPAIITQIAVYSTNGEIKHIPVKKIFDEVVIINFSETEVSKIEVFIEQQHTYKVDIGHFYSLKLNASDTIYDGPIDKTFNRMDLYKPSIVSLNAKYNTKEQIVEYNNSDITTNKQDIFNVGTGLSGIASDVEIMNVDRFCIGVKGARIALYKFKDKGNYLSTKFTTSKEIKAITLNTNEEIQGNSSITFKISFDNGNSWIPIVSRDRVHSSACTIKINSCDAEYERNTTKIKYIERMLDTKDLQIKIELLGDKDNPYVTPIVYNYRLDIEVEEY